MDNTENNTEIENNINEYENVKNISELLYDYKEEIKILEYILEDSKKRYKLLQDSYPSESIFTSIYNWFVNQFQFLE